LRINPQAFFFCATFQHKRGSHTGQCFGFPLTGLD
jgi:hypothetical protein